MFYLPNNGTVFNYFGIFEKQKSKLVYDFKRAPTSFGQFPSLAPAIVAGPLAKEYQRSAMFEDSHQTFYQILLRIKYVRSSYFLFQPRVRKYAPLNK